MGAAENKEIVRKISSGEVGLLDYWAEDGVWIIPGLATYNGKREIAAKLVDLVSDRMDREGWVVV